MQLTSQDACQVSKKGGIGCEQLDVQQLCPSHILQTKCSSNPTSVNTAKDRDMQYGWCNRPQKGNTACKQCQMYISADEAHTAGRPVRQEREPSDICVKRGTLVLPMRCDTYHACQADHQKPRLSTISSLEASPRHVMWLWLYVTTMQCTKHGTCFVSCYCWTRVASARCQHTCQLAGSRPDASQQHASDAC